MTTRPKKERTLIVAAGYVREQEQPVDNYISQPSLFDQTSQPAQPALVPTQKKPTQTLEERMSNFVAQRLDKPGLYYITEQDRQHILLEIPNEQDPTRVYIAFHPDDEMTQGEFWELERKNKSHRIYTAHIFVKDRYDLRVKPVFFRRLAEIAHYKRYKSLKRYTKEQRDTIIELRLLEKLALKDSRRVAYYQNPTARLSESIRVYDMLPVTQDYFHQLVDEQRVRSFAGLGKNSRTWRLSKEILPQILSKAPAFLVLAPSTMQAFITTRQSQ